MCLCVVVLELVLHFTTMEDAVPRFLQPFTVIDSLDTRIREDAFRTDIVSSDSFTLAIASPLPPRDYDPKLLLRSLLEHRFMKPKPFYLPIVAKQQASLNQIKARKSVVVTYTHTVGQPISFNLEIARVKIGDIFTHQTYGHGARARQDPLVLATVLGELGVTGQHVESLRGDVQPMKLGTNFVQAALFLFNATCQAYALKANAPFVGYTQTPHLKVYKPLSKEASFNRHLRDPLAFVNMTNLVHALEGKSPPFSNEWIERHVLT